MVPVDMRNRLIQLLDNPGNCVDLWEDEEDAGFVYITDDDLHIAVTVGWTAEFDSLEGTDQTEV